MLVRWSGCLLREEQRSDRRGDRRDRQTGQRGWGRGAWGCAGHGCHLSVRRERSRREVRVSLSSLPVRSASAYLRENTHINVTPAESRENRVAAIRSDFHTSAPILTRPPLFVRCGIITSARARARRVCVSIVCRVSISRISRQRVLARKFVEGVRR